MRIFQRTGIIAVLLVLLSGAGIQIAAAQSIPSRPQGYVSDFAGVLDASQRNRLTVMASELERKTGAQLAVVALDSVKPDTIEQYAVRLFEKWGIGQRGKDNGVLVLVAVKDRKARIEVGYGLEGSLTDAVSRSIIEQFMIPAFRQSDYGKGILDGAAAVTGVVGQSYGVSISGQPQQLYQNLQRRPRHGSDALSFIFFIIMIILFIKNPRLFFYMMLFSSMGGGRRGSWSGGSGGFGGGFGGFGGGMSGGGGASGGW